MYSLGQNNYDSQYYLNKWINQMAQKHTGIHLHNILSKTNVFIVSWIEHIVLPEHYVFVKQTVTDMQTPGSTYFGRTYSQKSVDCN